LKQVRIGDVAFSKVLCGSNPFYGHSHFSEARDEEYRSRFDDESIRRTIRRCVELGVNAVESVANERIATILAEIRASHDSPIRYVGSTRIDETSQLKTHPKKLAYLIEQRADVCVIHSQFVDRPRTRDAIGGLDRFVDTIHEAGLLAGISTHQVRTVEICEQRGYGVDTYMFPLNLSGFVYPGYPGDETVHQRIDLVRGVDKPFILTKTLGAGRIPPDEGFRFVAEHAKPNDLISLGLAGEDEAAESIKLIEKYF